MKISHLNLYLNYSAEQIPRLIIPIEPFFSVIAATVYTIDPISGTPILYG